MKRLEVTFELSDEQKQRRMEVIQQLQKNPKVRSFLKTHELDASFLISHTGMFERWIGVLIKCEGCLGLSFCKQPTKGRYLDLKFEKMMYNELVSCEYQKEANRQLRHLKNVLLQNYSNEQKVLSLAAIIQELPKQNKNYISEVVQIHEFLDMKKKEGLFLFGRPGVGKTHLAIAIANEAARSNFRVAFVNVPDFANECKLLMQEKETLERKLRTMRTVDFLVLDDIGGENCTAWFRDELLLPILNERMDKQKTTYFTSNFDYETLEKHYASTNNGNDEPIKANRIIERIKALTYLQELSGENRRNKKNK